MNNLDKYDHMILDIIHQHKIENQCHIRLAVLERNFWKRIEEDTDLHVGKARIGERITNLYLDGLIQNKDGYALTKKGREQLAFALGKNKRPPKLSDPVTLNTAKEKRRPTRSPFSALTCRQRRRCIKILREFPVREFFFPVGQLAGVANGNDGATIQANLDVGLEFLLCFFLRAMDVRSLWIPMRQKNTSQPD